MQSSSFTRIARSFSTQNFYQVLGVGQSASQTVIKKAFRKLAKEYHPDSGRGADINRFKLISTAYNTLTNPEKRKQYDSLLGQNAEAAGSHNWEEEFKKQQFYRGQQEKQRRQGTNFYGNFRSRDDFESYYTKQGEERQKTEERYERKENEYSKRYDFYRTRKTDEKKFKDSFYGEYKEEVKKDAKQEAKDQFYNYKRHFDSFRDEFKWAREEREEERKAQEEYSQRERRYNNWENFRETRHKPRGKSEHDMYSRDKFTAYEPGEDSAMHPKNRPIWKGKKGRFSQFWTTSNSESWKVRRKTEDEAQFERIWEEVSRGREKESRDSFKRGFMSNQDLLKRVPLGYFAVAVMGGFVAHKGFIKTQRR